ncbi:unnamed protein product [Rhizophagus irregularis]|nr:unnamed protein product [Rhizophagus irregularis]CAB5109407.1 unnamed protein product [Rhizophagus irregularis]
MLSLINNNNMNKTPQEIRWKPKDLACILYYINDNFDEWYNDNYNFCVKAKEDTGVIWDARSIYNMVHTLFKVTEDYLKVGTKSTTCTIIWENREIYDLMKQIYIRTNKRMKESNQRVTRGHKNDGHILNSDQITIEALMDRPCLIEEIFHLCDEKIQKVVNSAAKSIENAEAEYNERINQITRYRSELIKRISETNKMCEEFRKF